jgi:signal transduction histidine kinase
LAHNLKSPVAQLIGLTDLLKKTVKMDGLAQETIEKIANSSQSLHDIINDLNQILHIRRGNDAYFEEVDLNNILRKVLYTLETDIRLKHAEIKIRADKEIEMRGVKAYFQSIFYNLVSNDLNNILRKVLYTLETDIRLKHAEIKIRADKEIEMRGVKAYFQSIFYNLVSNALKYTNPERTSVININIRKSNDDLVISVSDNGVGIDLENAGDKLFQLYQRVHSGYQGKGFGLFLTKTQVEAMGGIIEVDSTIGQGTTFRFVFSRNI